MTTFSLIKYKKKSYLLSQFYTMKYIYNNLARSSYILGQINMKYLIIFTMCKAFGYRFQI